ncbi:hypothetical protein FJY94_07380 [Candidatus Kaiserbacteria bacterium]|nr:hypothetical protein [Candidatus Kaiserbacteria bacterium]
MFEASQFTPTKWDSAEDKARFANQFAKFVSGSFRREDFPKWFYNSLHLTFGHIAHYDQYGFFATFFECQAGKVQFLAQCLEYPAYGDPDHTYCDVEKALKIWLRDGRYLERAKADLASQVEVAERVQLARLKDKYEA